MAKPPLSGQFHYQSFYNGPIQVRDGKVEGTPPRSHGHPLERWMWRRQSLGKLLAGLCFRQMDRCGFRMKRY